MDSVSENSTEPALPWDGRGIAPTVPEHQRSVAPKSRTNDSPASRFEQIVDVAADLFVAKGYSGTSMNDVAQAAGLLKGSLYHYIHTKEDLLYAIVQEAHQNTASLGRELLASDAGAVDKLRLVIRRHCLGTERHLAKIKVFYAESSRLDPERFAEIIDRRHTYERAIRELVRQGQREGTFAAHLDPRLTAAAILATLNSVQTWFKPGGSLSMELIIDGFTDLQLRSVGVETREERLRGATTPSGGGSG